MRGDPAVSNPSRLSSIKTGSCLIPLSSHTHIKVSPGFITYQGPGTAETRRDRPLTLILVEYRNLQYNYREISDR